MSENNRDAVVFQLYNKKKLMFNEGVEPSYVDNNTPADYIVSKYGEIRSVKDTHSDDDEENKSGRYEIDSVADSWDDYANELSEIKKNKPVDIGFPELQKTIKGALIKGLIVVGAAPSAGKTTLISQWAYNIAKSGRDVLIVSLEMSESELITRDLSRLTFAMTSSKDKRNKNKALTLPEIYTRRSFTAGIETELTEDQKKAFSNAVKEYRKVSEHIFIAEPEDIADIPPLTDVSADAIKQLVKALTAKRNGKAPVVFVDYLQLLSSPYDGTRCVYTDERRLNNHNVHIFKEISQEFNVPVFAVSSTSRTGYNQVDNEAFAKESGGIEYAADATLFIQYADAYKKSKQEDREKAIKAGQAKPKREMTISVLKNRAGERNRHFTYDYYAPYYFFDSENERTDKKKTVDNDDDEKKTIIEI